MKAFQLQPLYETIRRGGKAWYPLGPRVLWRVTGKDGLRYLHGQLTRDILNQPPGTACYALALTPKGKLEAECTVCRGIAGELWVEAPWELKEVLQKRWEKFLVADEVLFEECSLAWSLIHCFGSEPPVLSSNFLCWESRRLGLPGWDLWVPVGELEKLSVDLPQVPEPLWETLRSEMGIGRWGKELGPDLLPQEARLERYAIDFRKGCYVGQEVVSRLAYVGRVHRVLSLLAWQGEEGEPSEPVHFAREDTTPLKSTSLAYSFALNRFIALAFLPVIHSEPGTRYHSPYGPWQVIEFPAQLQPFP
ncbi:CAF17-like 4Fe-4S cluster assembly/insertion protein YgfZ [Candidatus Methylacidithermus pantelleriae]|uniref:tRNA-modifying protein YgfZ n=1 Tax=Candidatus Methylacidithermus pantelleriae TaxID=2744239 RepID=A0A8J2FNI2_9BACT|nr:hypothetical protein [Candidatus Methylacidithermus pantelleriae]CAF0696083.1 hypothetical protein MPNT_20110 [Candidatus Methylacidithermus pantelleriae]